MGIEISKWRIYLNTDKNQTRNNDEHLEFLGFGISETPRSLRIL